MLENEPDTLYQAWKADPNPTTLRSAVKALEPTQQHVLRSINAGGDPFLASKARTLTAKAVETFDPSYGAALPTWVSRQLLPLRRLKRKSHSAVPLPESIQLDAYYLMRAENEFLDEHNRDPDLEELSDAVGMPIRRIRKVRETFRPVPTEGAFNQESAGLPGATADYDDEALSYVYQDLDHLDRKILEMKTGYGGAEMLDGNVIGVKLNLSPSQVSRRSAKISLLISRMERDLSEL